MKIKTPSILKKLPRLTLGMLLIITLVYFVDFIVDLPYRDIMPLVTGSDYFWFDGRRIALLSTVPAFIFVIGYTFISMFSENYHPSKKSHQRVGIFTMVIFLLFITINAIALFFYLYLAIFTPYKNCEDPKLKHYFVTDYAICKTIVNNEFN
ncbi:hypothetical protein SIL08_13635 [Scandinavium sp. V105_16]|uniref:DUF1240 domain-containing protein n=1 Tax=Scandinavium lactucae TaxID=3095028 RepID=A0AAJ2S2W8_9ENTR|nr:MULTISPECIES: hypothetical protein [unclassified Scandinavium]MDX6021314.1 hypothetical protein [Scandinavium sp. V105_16]MDX6032989.1 hypothetical protein [Scandinavium sp. V105_12]